MKYSRDYPTDEQLMKAVAVIKAYVLPHLVSYRIEHDGGPDVEFETDYDLVERHPELAELELVEGGE